MMSDFTKQITWIEPYYDIILNLIPIDTKTLLDVGAGSGIFGFILKKTRPDLTRLTAIEPFGYKLDHYDKVIKQQWQDTVPIPPIPHDVITALEVIEHMDKSDALDFLEWCKVFAEKIIISTPYVFVKQPDYDNNPYQNHRCIVTIDDFLHAKYRVYLIANWYNKRFNIRIMTSRHLLFLLQRLEPLGLTITNIIGVYEK